MIDSNLQGAFVKIRKRHTWRADPLEKKTSSGGQINTLGPEVDHQPSTSALAEVLCEGDNAQLWMTALDKWWLSTRQCENCLKHWRGTVKKEHFQILTHESHMSLTNSS